MKNEHKRPTGHAFGSPRLDSKARAYGVAYSYGSERACGETWMRGYARAQAVAVYGSVRFLNEGHVFDESRTAMDRWEAKS